MNKSSMVILGVVLLLVLGGFFYFMRSGQSNPSPVTQVSQDQVNSDSNSDSSASGTAEAGVKELTVTGSSFKFEPATLTVNKGDKVRVTFKNSGGMHNFVIDEFNVKTKVIPADQQEVVEFTADKTGVFKYYCGVGNHRQMGMEGTLTVQ